MYDVRCTTGKIVLGVLNVPVSLCLCVSVVVPSRGPVRLKAHLNTPPLEKLQQALFELHPTKRVQMPVGRDRRLERRIGGTSRHTKNPLKMRPTNAR